MEDFTAGDVRARTFRVAMRGFDQGEVGGYLEQLAGYLEAVQQQLHQMGITELSSPHDLAAEYGAVGDEVARVLEEARSAADAMRSRATADTARWRADAEVESEQLRRSAWEAATWASSWARTPARRRGTGDRSSPPFRSRARVGSFDDRRPARARGADTRRT